MCCSTPADIYLLLKSSDLIQHDLDSIRAYASGDIEEKAEDEEEDEEEEEEGRVDRAGARDMKIELVLRSFVEMNPSREMRCFVRQNMLLGEFLSSVLLYISLPRDELLVRIIKLTYQVYLSVIRTTTTTYNLLKIDN